jgi:hypothetical protein
VARAAARCHHANTHCVNCDLLVDLDDLHVIDVDRGDGDRLTVRVESARMVMGCRTCGAMHVHRAEPYGGRAAGAAHRAGVLVGDPTIAA